MTTLSNTNIVLQQSGGAKEAQNIRHATQDYSQVLSGQQKEKDSQQRTTVQQSEDSKRSQLDKDPPEKRRRRRRMKSEGKKATAIAKPFRGEAGDLVQGEAHGA